MNIFIGLFGFRIWLIQFNMTINNNDTKQKKIIKWTNNKRNNNNKKELIITYTQKQQQQTERQQKLTRPITTITTTTLPVSAATMKTKLTTFKFFFFRSFCFSSGLRVRDWVWRRGRATESYGVINFEHKIKFYNLWRCIREWEPTQRSLVVGCI